MYAFTHIQKIYVFIHTLPAHVSIPSILSHELLSHELAGSYICIYLYKYICTLPAHVSIPLISSHELLSFVHIKTYVFIYILLAPVSIPSL